MNALSLILILILIGFDYTVRLWVYAFLTLQVIFARSMQPCIVFIYLKPCRDDLLTQSRAAQLGIPDYFVHFIVAVCTLFVATIQYLTYNIFVAGED